jgi:hypothetical protein
LGRWFGIDVIVHWTFLLLIGLLVVGQLLTGAAWAAVPAALGGLQDLLTNNLSAASFLMQLIWINGFHTVLGLAIGVSRDGNNGCSLCGEHSAYVLEGDGIGQYNDAEVRTIGVVI